MSSFGLMLNMHDVSVPFAWNVTALYHCFDSMLDARKDCRRGNQGVADHVYYELSVIQNQGI